MIFTQEWLLVNYKTGIYLKREAVTEAKFTIGTLGMSPCSLVGLKL
jgi:hypothetical protein